jgi:beta-xylosidase
LVEIRRDGNRGWPRHPPRASYPAARARRHLTDRPHLHPAARALGVLEEIDVIAVHGFPLDWNLWKIDEWPQKLHEIREVTTLPIWVSEVGVSSFGADEVQAWGLERTAQLLRGRAPRIHWFSLDDLPTAWEATTRHK